MQTQPVNWFGKGPASVSSVLIMAISCNTFRATCYMQVLFTFVLIFMRSTAWNLPNDLFLWKFAIWRNRVYLTAPRWKVENNRIYDGQSTLLETTWPEVSTNNQLRSQNYVHSFSNKQLNSDCLRSVVGLQTDAKGRLWALEVPDKPDCSARVVVRDLKRNKQVFVQTQLKNVPTKNLRALVVDQSGSTAYIGDPGDEFIIIFSLERRKWWTTKLIHGPEIPRVYSTDLAISKKNSILYLTGPNTLDLFSINLEELQFKDGISTSFNFEPQNISVFWHGTKMGYSSGLFCDVKGGLHYFMTSEKASVRWDTKLPLRAESHMVLLQNTSFPCISDYTMDSQRNIWGLVSSGCPFSKKNILKVPGLQSRTVKIMKHL